MSITPKNWKDFQHYKDRAPAWIKLHKRLLDDFEFASLPVASRALAPMLWLLASEYEDGEITASIEAVAFRLRTSVEELHKSLKPLVDAGFFSVDSSSLAPRYQGSIPEKEVEKETEKKTDICAVGEPTRTRESPSEDFQRFWTSYPKRDGANPKHPAEKAFAAAVKSGTAPTEIIGAADRYRSQMRTKGQEGTPYVSQAVTWLRQRRWQDYPAADASAADPAVSREHLERVWTIFLERKRDGRDLPKGVKESDIPADFIAKFQQSTPTPQRAQA